MKTRSAAVWACVYYMLKIDETYVPNKDVLYEIKYNFWVSML